MSIENDLYATLGPVVSGRCWPNHFQQGCAWPAIRYAIQTYDDPTVCGSAEDDNANHSVAIDIVAETYEAVRALRLAVRTELRTAFPEHTIESDGGEWDSDAKVHRQRLVVLIQPSG